MLLKEEGIYLVTNVEVDKMEKMLRQSITNYKMPRYISEILSNNYDKFFLNMSIICEKQAYIFSYDTKNYKRLVYKSLGDYEKLRLIHSLMLINEKNKEMLIFPERYLLEPELIYSINNKTDIKNLRILFYPDINRTAFNIKLIKFINNTVNKKKIRGVDCFELIKEELGKGDYYRAKSVAEKYIQRFEREIAV